MRKVSARKATQTRRDAHRTKAEPVVTRPARRRTEVSVSSKDGRPLPPAKRTVKARRGIAIDKMVVEAAPAPTKAPSARSQARLDRLEIRKQEQAARKSLVRTRRDSAKQAKADRAAERKALRAAKARDKRQAAVERRVSRLGRRAQAVTAKDL